MDIPKPKSNQPIPETAKRVFKGVIFDVYQWEQEMYDGSKAVFEKLKRPDTVVVFPVLPDGRILLTKQEQPGKDSFIGAPGGRVDEGEDVLMAARRELLEESGYEAEEYILWNAQQPVSKIEWSVYTFIAKGLKKVSEINPDAGEKIELMPVTLDELIDQAGKKNFGDREMTLLLREAKYNKEKIKKLRELFRT